MSAGRVIACPVCSRTIVYVDGFGSPALVMLARVEPSSTPGGKPRGEQRIVGCEACYGKPRAPAAPPPRRRGARFVDPRPVRQIVKDDVGAALGLVLEGLDVADAARGFWDRLTGKAGRLGQGVGLTMWLLVLVGAGVAYLVWSKPSSAQSTASLAQQTTAQANAWNSAQAFDVQAQALGLSQYDAQNAYSLGLSPLEYVESGMATSSPNLVAPWGSAPALTTAPPSTVSGPLLTWYGDDGGAYHRQF